MKLQLNLRKRLVLLVAAALIPLFGLSIINARLNADAAVSRATGNLEFAASLVAANQDRVVLSAHQLLTSIVNVPGLVNGDIAQCQRYIGTLRKQLGLYSNLGIIDLGGRIRCHALDEKRPNAFVGDRDYVQAALANQKFTVGGYTLGRASGKEIITFVMPVMDSQGQLTALAFATMGIGEISTAMGTTSLPQGSRVAVMDRQGIVLTTNPANPLLIGKQVATSLLQEAVKTMRTGIAEAADAEGQQRIFSFLPSARSTDSPFFVSVSADKDEVLAPVRNQFQLEMAALTLLAFLSGWLTWIMGGRAIVKPAAEILEASSQLQQGRLDVRIASESVRAGGELAQIAAGINRMAESLQLQQGLLEAELLHSQATQEKLQDAQRLARIGYWQIDLATELISCSDETYELWGVDRSVFNGTYDSFLKLIYPGDREAFKIARDLAVQSGAPLEFEFRIVTPKGDVRWMHQFCRVDNNREGDSSTVRMGLIQDITQRKNAELAIARGTELLNRTGALAKVGGWELLIETMTPYWSEETYRIHELDPSSGIDFEDIVKFYDIEARSAMRAAVNAALENATPWDMELGLITATGRSIWVRSQGRALQEDGKAVRLVGVLQDISEQHAAQAHLRLLQTCISRLNDMVMIFKVYPHERRTCITFVNEAFTRQMGYSLEETVGQSTALMHGSKTAGAGLSRIIASIRNCKPVRAELIHYTKSGDEIWVETDLVPLFDTQGGVTEWVSVERDITQRKLAEQALIDSEQRYAVLFDAAPVFMWVYDIATTRFLAVNHAAAQAYGYTAAEFLTMTIFDILPEIEHASLRQNLAEPEMAQKQSWQHRRKDGSLFPVDIVARTVQYAHRATRFVVAVDKTAQGKAERDVQDYLFTLQRAADAAQAITWHQTLEGTMQEIAEQARGVIGAHQAVVSLSGDSASQLIHALSLSEKYAAYRGLMKPLGQGAIHAMVCENNRSVRLTQAELEIHPHWSEFACHADRHPAMRGCLAVPLIGRSEKNIGLLLLSDKYEGEFTKQDEYVALELAHLAAAAIENARLLEEISQLNAGLEQKVAERTVALARQEALFRALAEQAPQTVWMASPDGAATYCNRAWFDLMGGELKDWTRYQWLAVVHPEDVPDIKAKWKVAKANQSPYAGLRRLLAKDGSYHTMAYRASPVLDDQGEVAFWVGIDADITDIKAIEAALRLSNQELEAFSYSVSHDLRSPLNTVDGFSRLLAKQLAPQMAGAAGEKTKHYLSRIQAGVAQMGQLIEDLLSLSQVTRAQLRTEPVDLSAMARSLMEEWQARQPERKVLVHIQSGMQAEADGRLIKVVMENLLANAWKFTSQKELAEIRIGQNFDAAGLPMFFVRDNGAGFDMAYANKLFEPFQRLHAASDFPGTGIGLATVSRVIKRHGGRIWTEAAPGCGATFFFTLPPVRHAALGEASPFGRAVC
jgi:PAS domain S-box-containing protein